MWNWLSLTDCTQNNLSWSPAQLCQTTSRTAVVWNQSCCPSDSLQAAAVRGTVWLHMVQWWKLFSVEPPFNSQNDRVYAPVDNKKRCIDPSRQLRTSVMVSVAAAQVDMTELIFVNPGVKVNGYYYCDVLLSQQMLPAIKRVAGHCLFTKQYVAHGEIGRFLCSAISQGKVVALDSWGEKWNHLSMAHRHTTDYAKNYCFFGTPCRFVCYHVIMLSSLKLHAKNNACMFLLLTSSAMRNRCHFQWCNLWQILNYKYGAEPNLRPPGAPTYPKSNWKYNLGVVGV